MRQRARGSRNNALEDPSLVVQVSDLAPGGDGLGRLEDGRVVFVRGALPGDTVEIAVESDKRSHVFARVRELVRPSDERVSAPCPIVDRCGGCPLMRLSAKAQVRAKESMLRQSLVRIGRLSEAELALVRPMISAPALFGYRNRLRVQHRAGRLGFFRDKTHELVAVDECKIASEAVNQLLRETSSRLVGRAEGLVGLELRVLPPREGEAVAARSIAFLVDGEKSGPLEAWDQATRSLEEIAAVRVVPLRGPMGAAPPGSFQKLWLEPDLFVFLAPGAFNQVNLAVNSKLIELVLDAARCAGAQTFLDLYGGAGNFTMPLLKRGLGGVLVEVQEESVRAARLAAKAQGFDRGEFFAGDVPRVARALARRGRRADLVILDPPRKGAMEALEAALGLAEKAIVLVSCDPPTLARDLRFLLDRGACLLDLTPLDMFPHTHHLEVVARVDVRGCQASVPKCPE